jgi:hypothetical protein
MSCNPVPAPRKSSALLALAPGYEVGGCSRPRSRADRGLPCPVEGRKRGRASYELSIPAQAHEFSMRRLFQKVKPAGCSAGQYVVKTAPSNCLPCPPGTYSSAFGKPCSPCGAGKFSTGGAASCDTCAAGSTNTGNTNSVCTSARPSLARLAVAQPATTDLLCISTRSLPSRLRLGRH